MNVFPSTTGGARKRAVDNSALIPTTLHEIDPNAPRILKRHQNRRRNIAATVWGPDVPDTLQSARGPPFSTGPKAPFSVYKAILRHPNLFFQFAKRLPHASIIDLYAIDKEFHYRLNKYSVSLIHDYAKYHAPLASYIFSWMLYPDLCISDPMLKPMDGREWLARDVPGFRWVGMILWRQHVVRSILTHLALEAHRVPSSAEAALMKFWCLMEMKSTAMRKAFLQDRKIWTDEDIYSFQLFQVKLDMRFTDAVLGNGVCELSYMLLTQKSMSTIWKVLKGAMKLDYDALTDMMVRTHPMEHLDTDTHTWLDDEADNGVPEEEWGLLMKEGWDTDGGRMDSPVDMVIDEGLSRGLNIHERLLDFVKYGHVDDMTGTNAPVPRLLRTDEEVNVPRETRPTEVETNEFLERFRESCKLDKGVVFVDVSG